jgi:hypothetical protein
VAGSPWPALAREAGASAVEFARWTVRKRQSAGAYRRALARHKRAMRKWRTLTVGGYAGAGGAAGIGVMDSSDAGQLLLALAFALAGCGLGVFAKSRRAQLVPPDPADHPLVTVAYDSRGGRALRRLDDASRRMRHMCLAVTALDQATGEELEQAARLAERSLRLTAQHLGTVERLAPGPMAGWGSVQATDGYSGYPAAPERLIAQLEHGVAAYEKTLAAAAELLAAPSLGPPVAATLQAAQDALAARTYGQTTAAERLSWPG